MSQVRSWDLLDVAGKGVDVEFMMDVVSGPGWRIEWIVSRGQQTEPGDWYDQDADEWALVVSGGARLQIHGEDTERELQPGQAVWLPARCRHRVTWTDPDQATVWCVMFAQPGGSFAAVDPGGSGPVD